MKLKDKETMVGFDRGTQKWAVKESYMTRKKKHKNICDDMGIEYLD